MPSIRTQLRQKLTDYEGRMLFAIGALKNEEIRTVRETARRFDIPKSTLHPIPRLAIGYHRFIGLTDRHGLSGGGSLSCCAPDRIWRSIARDSVVGGLTVLAAHFIRHNCLFWFNVAALIG